MGEGKGCARAEFAKRYRDLEGAVWGGAAGWGIWGVVCLAAPRTPRCSWAAGKPEGGGISNSKCAYAELP